MIKEFAVIYMALGGLFYFHKLINLKGYKVFLELNMFLWPIAFIISFLGMLIFWLPMVINSLVEERKE